MTDKRNPFDQTVVDMKESFAAFLLRMLREGVPVLDEEDPTKIVEYRAVNAAELGVIRAFLKDNPVPDAPPPAAAKGILKEFENRFKDSGLPVPGAVPN